MEAVGLEPDPDIHREATSRGLRVWRGFFPADVRPGSRFDVVVFNDVLEPLAVLSRLLPADTVAQVFRRG